MKFSDVLDIRNGRNQRQVENKNGKYPIYGSGGVMGRADDYICDAETVVIGRKGSINNPIFVNEPFWNVDTAFGLVAHREVLLPKYLYYFCVKFNFEQLNTTVTIPSLTKANLLQIEINVPDMETQLHVVGVLDKICHLIELRQKQLHELDQVIKSRFIELFGDVKTNKFGWEKCRFGDVSVKITDGEHGTVPRVNKDDGYLYLMARNITKDGTVDLSETSYVPEDVHRKIYKRCNPEKDDILLVCVGATIGKCTIVPADLGEFSMARSVALIKPDKRKVDSTFLVSLLKSDAIQSDISECAHAAAQAGLYTNMIVNLDAFLPPLELQNQFSAFVEQTDKSKMAIQQSLDKLEMLKKSLMQQYFG
ncbi:MAG: restriction endonuclease subunit S [Lachnospiraceae bacterium]|nr:restriction endonuclease subunit S [Lachnospiraceae bacterium]